MKFTIETRDILGLPIAIFDQQGALSVLRDALVHKKALRLAFANANLANMAFVNSDLHESLQSFVLLNDGSGMNIASKLLYRKKFPANLNGTDFVPFFLANCDLNLRIFLLGSSPEVVKKAFMVFGENWPQHMVVGYQHGFFTDAQAPVVFDTIKMAEPDIVLVAMGNGRQEFWVDKLVPIATISAWGIGAFFDFLANEVTRAPNWMRRLGIEWIYRLIQEPGRLWKRYLIGNFKFIYSVMCQFLSKLIHS